MVLLVVAHRSALRACVPQIYLSGQKRDLPEAQARHLKCVSQVVDFVDFVYFFKISKETIINPQPTKGHLWNRSPGWTILDF